jgi:hypothetical protein
MHTAKVIPVSHARGGQVSVVLVRHPHHCTDRTCVNPRGSNTRWLEATRWKAGYRRHLDRLQRRSVSIVVTRIKQNGPHSLHLARTYVRDSSRLSSIRSIATQPSLCRLTTTSTLSKSVSFPPFPPIVHAVAWVLLVSGRSKSPGQDDTTKVQGCNPGPVELVSGRIASLSQRLWLAKVEANPCRPRPEGGA